MGTHEAAGHLKAMGLWLTGVCFPADKGTVQKVIVLPKDDLQTEELVLEEVEVFKVGFKLILSLFPLQQFSDLLDRLLLHFFFFNSNLCFFSCQGPDTDHNNEDLIQKSKRVFLKKEQK